MTRSKVKVEKDSSWEEAWRLCCEYLRVPRKADDLWQGESLRSSVKALLGDALRMRSAVETLLAQAAAKAPKVKVEGAIWLIVAHALMQEEVGKRAAVVHFGVEQLKGSISRPECGFVNAVCRRMLRDWDEWVQDAQRSWTERMAMRWGHPNWLVEKWLGDFGEEAAEAFLRWNQRFPRHYVHFFDEGSGLPEGLLATDRKGVYQLGHASWSEVLQRVRGGQAYIQDPGTLVGVDLADVRAGERVLDLCASPGGKSVCFADILRDSGHLVSVDLPHRAERLRDNLSVLAEGSYEVVEADLLTWSGYGEGEKALFDVVFLDAPCSNTGVIGRRPDVRLRLREESLAEVVRLQQQLLRRAAAWVKPGGRLLYNTCSVEVEENQKQIDCFLQSAEGECFTSSGVVMTYPWRDGCDGAGSCLLLRS